MHIVFNAALVDAIVATSTAFGFAFLNHHKRRQYRRQCRRVSHLEAQLERLRRPAVPTVVRLPVERRGA